LNERIRNLLDYVNLAHRETWAVLSGLQPADLARHVYSSEGVDWKVQDVVAHVADAEHGLLGQIRRLLAGQPTVPDDFDLNRWNRSAVRKRAARTYAQVLEELERGHEATAAALAEVDPGDLDRIGRHPSGKMLNVDGYFRRMADHRREHTADIQKALSAAKAGGTAARGRTVVSVAGIHDLVLLQLPSLQVGTGVSRWIALQSSDRLLRRFGQADVLRLEDGITLALKERTTADEVWALIEGQATFEWEDLRPASPTSASTARLSASEPIAVLVPFGVAFRVTADGGTAVLLRLSTHGDDEEPVTDLFRASPPS
jgi:hypothetical protein